MKVTLIIIFLLIFFAGGFYLGQKSKEGKIKELTDQISLLQRNLINREKEIGRERENLKKSLLEIKNAWEEKKEEIAQFEKKIDEFFIKFIPLNEEVIIETGKNE